MATSLAVYCAINLPLPQPLAHHHRLMSDWKVELVEDNISEFYVEFGGPKDSECSLSVLVQVALLKQLTGTRVLRMQAT